MLLSICEVALSRLANERKCPLKHYLSEAIEERYYEEDTMRGLMVRVRDILCNMISQCVDLSWLLFDSFIPTKHPDGTPVVFGEMSAISDTQVTVEVM